jgi:hypothetical protein
MSLRSNRMCNAELSQITDRQFEAHAFDWDDNVMRMPTTHLVEDRQSGQIVGIDTRQWVVFREDGLIGSREEGKRYVVLANTWERFKMKPGVNMFLEDLAQALESPEQTWRGPAWARFVAALSTRASARRTAIVTARGHHPDEIHQGLRLLQRHGQIRELPPLESTYPVTHPEMSAQLQETAVPAAKSRAAVRHLEEIARQAEIWRQGRELRLPEQAARWTFTDDDASNLEAVRSQVSKACTLSNGHPRWPWLEVTVIKTSPCEQEWRWGLSGWTLRGPG